MRRVFTLLNFRGVGGNDKRKPECGACREGSDGGLADEGKLGRREWSGESCDGERRR